MRRALAAVLLAAAALAAPALAAAPPFRDQVTSVGHAPTPVTWSQNVGGGPVADRPGAWSQDSGSRPVAIDRGAPPARIVVVGLPDLAWAGLPAALRPFAETAAIGSLSVRAATAVTRPYDGWVTLGAGNRARARLDTPLPDPDYARGFDPAVAALDADNDTLFFDARVGALGEALHAVGLRTAAFGRGAVLALADPAGRVDVAAPPTADPVAFTGGRDADVVVVDLSGRERDAAAVLAATRPDDLVLVVGVSDGETGPPGLRVAMARGPGYDAGRLVSASTRRAGFVQLIDVAPTVLDALGPEPPAYMSGRPWRATGGRHDGEIARLVDAARAADAHRRLVPPFFVILVGAELLLYGGSWLAVRRMPRASARAVAAARRGALFFTAAPVATYLAHLVPWWRHDLWFLLLAVAVAELAVVGVAVAGPWRKAVLGPPGAVAAVTALVLAADLTTGARLQMSSLAGYSPIVAGRFAGVGNVAFAVFATSALLATAALCAGRSRRFTATAVAASATVAVVVDGSPTWGSDFGGVLALVPAYAVLAMLLLGVRPTWRRLVAVAAVAVAAVTVFALVDYARPPDVRSHLGRFVEQVRDGGALTVIERKAKANVRLLGRSVLTLLVPVAVSFLAIVVLRPRGALRSAYDRHPALRAGLIASLTLGVVGFAVNDSGVAVPAWVLTLAVPFALSASLRSADQAP